MSAGEGVHPFDAPGAAAHPPSSPAARDARQQAALALVRAIHGLIHACLRDEGSDQAVLSQVPAAVGCLVEVCELLAAPSATLSFGGDAVLVQGEPLRLEADAMAFGGELAGLLRAGRVTEIAIDKAIRRAELAAFARLVASAQRDRGSAERLARCDLRGIRVTCSRASTTATPAQDDAAAEQASRAYAGALLVVRAFYYTLKGGEAEPGKTQPGPAAMTQRVERAAQLLVSVAEHDTRSLLELAAGRRPEPDEAGLAVPAAVVALSIARQLTTERRLLAALVTAALLHDAGRVRIVRALQAEGAADAALEQTFDADDADRLPASAAVALTALGGLQAPAIARTVIAYEALALRSTSRAGQLYVGRRPPALLARILATARTFVELRAAPLPSSTVGAPGRLAAPAPAPPRVDEVLQRMLSGAEGTADRDLVRLLIGALGMFPIGTLVELGTGEIAVVTGLPASPAFFAHPPVSILRDRQGALLEPPLDVDLAAGPLERRCISRPIEPEAQHTKALRSALAAAKAASSGALSPDKRSTMPPTQPAERERGVPSLMGTGPRSAPGARIEAAWLGKPLSSQSASAAPQAAPRRPPPVDRAALLEKIRAEELASTKPPPPGAMPAFAVPPPPPLPRASNRPSPPSVRPPTHVEGTRERGVPTHMEDPTTRRSHQLPTIEPPPPPPSDRARLDPQRPWSPRRAVDPRAEPDDRAHELPTIEPPPPAVRAPSPLTTLDDVDPEATWTDDFPTMAPPPPAAADFERDRLLAAYLTEVPPPSRPGAPPPRSGPPRLSRPPIPREEPTEDTRTPPPPSRRSRP